MALMSVTPPGTLLHRNGKHSVPQTVRFSSRCATVHKAEVPGAGDAAEAEAAATTSVLRILAQSPLRMTPRRKQLDNQMAHAANVAVVTDVDLAEGLMDLRIRLDS